MPMTIGNAFGPIGSTMKPVSISVACQMKNPASSDADDAEDAVAHRTERSCRGRADASRAYLMRPISFDSASVAAT